MALPFETNNVTDMFPPYKYDMSDYCDKKWSITVRRPDWLRTEFWGKSECVFNGYLYKKKCL